MTSPHTESPPPQRVWVLELIVLFNAIIDCVAWVSICNTKGLEKELQFGAGMMNRKCPLNESLCPRSCA